MYIISSSILTYDTLSLNYNNIFYFINTCSLFNYADDNTIITVNNNPDVVIDYLVLDSNIAIPWFKNNYMLANPDKFQLLLVCNVKLLGVNIDERLTFDELIT